MAGPNNTNQEVTRGVLTNDGARRALNFLNDLMTPDDSGKGYRKDVVTFMRDEKGNIKETHTRKVCESRYLKR